MAFFTSNHQRALVVYGIRLGLFGYGHEPDERTEMLVKEYGFDLVKFERQDKSFGWYDGVVTNMNGINHYGIISYRGNGGRMSLDPNPDPDLTERLNKFRSVYEGDLEEPRWHIYLFDTSSADSFLQPEFFTYSD